MGKREMKKRISLVMAVLLVMILALPMAQPASAAGLSGTCGDDLSWSINAGTLTITGSGAMTDFQEPDMAPWFDHRDSILRLELPEGLTNIGDLAFFGFAELKTVAIPNSVVTIGQYAFAECEKLSVLKLSNTLRIIGDSAFSECRSLVTVNLPESLQEIHRRAFYRCESMTFVVVPSQVKVVGQSVFAYCVNLIRAEIKANLTNLPELTFLGCDRLDSVILPTVLEQVENNAFLECDNLLTVYYDGAQENREQIEESINEASPVFDEVGFLSPNPPDPSASFSEVTENEDGSWTQHTVTIVPGQNSSVSTSTENIRPADTTIGGTYNTEIIVSVENADGWAEVAAPVEDVLEQMNEAASMGGQVSQVQIVVQVKDSGDVNREFVDSLAGEDVKVTVITGSGSSWRVDCSEMDPVEEDVSYDFSYILNNATKDQLNKIDAGRGFVLKFKASAQVNAEVLIALPKAYVRQTAVLFEGENNPIRHQAVIVDDAGFAHFYLGAVSSDVTYFIGFDIADISQEDVIIPDELLGDYGVIERLQPIQYTITGRSSSWGVNVNQVTWIMIGGMAAVVIVVGVAMYILNKRKLKMGYVPEITEEDYEDFE